MKHLSHPKPLRILHTIMPSKTTPKTVLEQAKADVAFSRMQSRPGGPEVAVMTSIDLLDKLIAGAELIEWIEANVGNIDFHVKAPAHVMSTNPWIATGANFMEAVAKAKRELDTTALPHASRMAGGK